MIKETIVMGIITWLGIDRRKNAQQSPCGYDRREPSLKEARQMYHDAIKDLNETIVAVRQRLIKK